MKLRKIAAIAVACALVLSLAGCGAKNKKEESKQEDTVESSDTIVVKDAKGEVTIPANPKRIVDISGNSDILSILGYSVVGTANSDAYDYTKFPSYLEKVLKGAKILGYSMQDKMDVEAILALNPDMIIISSVQESMYDQLQDVAPTVMIELAQIDWTDDVLEVAEIFDKTDEAKSWLSDYEEKAQKAGADLKAKNGEDATYLSFLASAGNIYIFDAAGMGSVLYDDMGLARPEGMPEQTDISLPVVTYEGLAAINADYILAIGTEEDLAALTESSVWNSIPAVTNGKVVQLPASPYFNMGYSSIGRNALLGELPQILESVNE